jgi:hypothetical protein
MSQNRLDRHRCYRCAKSMSIALADEKPETEHKASRANFRWTLTEPWDERRLAAFLMTKHRRNDADWTRRSSPFFASFGQMTIECSIPVTGPETLPELERLLTRELLGILTGASRVYEEMASGPDWKKVTPP